MSKLVATAVIVAAIALTALATARESARAANPEATNGRLAFASNIGGGVDAYSVRPEGQKLSRQTGDAREAPSWTLLDPIPTRADAAIFLAEVVRQVVANDYAAAWQSLYSAHQAVAPLEEYVACELKSPIPVQLDRLAVVRARWARLHVAGQPSRMRGVRVTFSLWITDPSLGSVVELRLTFGALWIGGRWAWMLPPSRYQLYLTNSC
jgi:hypothetical protein